MSSIDKSCRENLYNFLVLKILFIIYIILSYFETYLIPFLGNCTKYLILLIIGMIIIENNRVEIANSDIKRFNAYAKNEIEYRLREKDFSLFFILWFIFLCLSMIWSNFLNESYKVHFFTILGNVLLITVIGNKKFDYEFLRLILQCYFGASFVFGILSVLFHESYLDSLYISRQVLTLFGQQNDPNNCSAFLMIGFSFALYSIIYEKSKIWLNLIIIIINGYAILLTSSRTGFIGIGIIAIIFFIFSNKRNIKSYVINNIVKYFFILFGIAMIVMVGIKYLPEDNINRLFMFEQYRDGSGRGELLNYALDLIRKRPLIGWGWGGYYYPEMGLHNTFLAIMCDSGVIGLLLFIIPIISICIQAVKTGNIIIIVVITCGLFPSLFIDAINKRFFWNSIIFSIMIINYCRITKENFTMW